MKKVILFILLCGFVFQSQGYDRKSLVERFTNTSCGPCATLNNAWYNATTHSLVSNETISHIVYNVNWPGPTDPMYLLNPTDNMARRTYYSVSWVPWPVVNGVYFDYQSLGQSDFTNAVNTGNSQFSPFMLELVQNALSDNLIKFTLTIHRDPTDVTVFTNTKLRVALTEKTVSFPSPPGSNGESEFFSVTRKMIPNAAGLEFTIPDPGQSTEVILEYVPTAAFLQAVNMDSLRVVAFIQNDNSKYVYQSEMFELLPNFVALIHQASSDVISDNNAQVEFDAVIRNIGIMDDIYDISINAMVPAGWTGEYTTVNGTFPFAQGDAVAVQSGDSTLISVTLNLNGNDGYGQTEVVFASQSNPGMGGTVTLRNVTTTGIDFLVVGANEDGYESYMAGSLDNVYSGSYGIVSRSALQQSGADLSGFKILGWAAGNTVPAFYPEEVTNLEYYLDHGGKLFITGQDIGNDIFGTNAQSQFAQSFYNNYLHADYVANLSSFFIVKGIAGDPISDGIQFLANTVYDLSLDKIMPYDTSASSVFYYYNGPDVAGIKAATETHGIVYFSFGMEQINEQAIRDTVLSRSIQWLTDVVTGVEQDEDITITSFMLEQNYPNPFNPATRIKYQLPEASQVSIKIFDILGKEIATLVNEFKEAGAYEVEFNSTGLASGIYFYRMSGGGFVSVKKMNILK